MNKAVPIVKTLPHLISRHNRQMQIGIYATGYTPQVHKYLLGLEWLSRGGAQSQIVNTLTSADYKRVDYVSAVGEFTVKGDALSLWLPGYQEPIKVVCDFGRVESLQTYDINTGRKLRELSKVALSSQSLVLLDKDILHVDINTDYESAAIFVQSNISIPDELINFGSQIYTDFAFPPLFWGRFDLLAHEINKYIQDGLKVHIQTSHLQDLPADLLLYTHQEQSWQVPENLVAGFASANERLVVFTDRELFGSVFLSQRQTATTNSAKLLMQFAGEIEIGDYLVHEEYGICIYTGLTQEKIEGELREYLSLQFAGTDELLLPIDSLHKLTKYIGDGVLTPKLSALGKGDWQNSQAKVRKSVKISAEKLVSHYAMLQTATAPSVPGDDSDAYIRFTNQFGLTPTDDQIRAVNEIVADMQKTKPMNRLLIGDVGFGKTEVIMRAIFKVVESGYQAIVLCPTTILCAQHYTVFTNRFVQSGYKVGYLSRFQTAKDNQATVDKFRDGKINILVGTHALLRSDLKLTNLALVVVDEEQRFGVKQKEKLRQLNYQAHYLSVSATPIPRTLGMALAQIQEISLITQPPIGRKPINTKVGKLDWNEVASAIRFEVNRGGQVYFVHNHVEDINAVAQQLGRVLPEVRIVVAHGQLSPSELDRRIFEFYKHKFDLLLCTTIIENGIDMPNVNTIVVHQAQAFGLSQLYQLRGRVGRSEKPAYCYLFYTGQDFKKDTEGPDYLKRLQAMAEATQLGAGFSIASKDLEIRGAGNLLGQEQHGHITQVGYALYMQLLQQEVDKLKSNLAPSYDTHTF